MFSSSLLAWTIWKLGGRKPWPCLCFCLCNCLCICLFICCSTFYLSSSLCLPLFSSLLAWTIWTLGWGNLWPCLWFCISFLSFYLSLSLSLFSSFLLASLLGQSEKLGVGKVWPCLKTFLDLGFVTLSSHTANSNFSFPTCLKIFQNFLFFINLLEYTIPLSSYQKSLSQWIRFCLCSRLTHRRHGGTGHLGESHGLRAEKSR